MWPAHLRVEMNESCPDFLSDSKRSFEILEESRIRKRAGGLRSVNGLPGLSADTADLISVDSRSVRSRLLDFLTEEPFIGHLSRQNVIGGKTVELTVRPTVKLRHGLFENSDDVVIRIRLLWKEILVLHGLVSGLRSTVGKDHFDFSDSSSSVKHGCRVTPVDSPDGPQRQGYAGWQSQPPQRSEEAGAQRSPK